MKTHTTITTDDVRQKIASIGTLSFTAQAVTVSLLANDQPGKSAVAYVRNRLNELVDLAELTTRKVGRNTMYVASTPEITNAEIDGLLDKTTPVKPMPTKTKPVAKRTKAAPKAKATTAPSTKNKLITVDAKGRKWFHGSKTPQMEHPDGLAYVDGLKIGKTGKTPHGVVFADAYFLDPHTGGFTLGSRLAPKNAEGGRVTDDKPVARYYFVEAWIRAAPRPFPPKKNEGRKWYERRGGSWVIVTQKQKEAEVGTTATTATTKATKPATKATTKATKKKAAPQTDKIVSGGPPSKPSDLATVAEGILGPVPITKMSKTEVRKELTKAGITMPSAATKGHLKKRLTDHRAS